MWMVSSKTTVMSPIYWYPRAQLKKGGKDFFNQRQNEATKPQAGHMDTVELMSSSTSKKKKVWKLKCWWSLSKYFQALFTFVTTTVPVEKKPWAKYSCHYVENYN